MLKSIQTILKQDKEMFVVPRRVQDLIQVQRIWPDGIFQVGPNKFSKTWKFSDINYQVASEEDKEKQKGYIALIGLTKRVLETCIDLLGFEAPDKM